MWPDKIADKNELPAAAVSCIVISRRHIIHADAEGKVVVANLRDWLLQRSCERGIRSFVHGTAILRHTVTHHTSLDFGCLHVIQIQLNH
jgi:hypothetical protein